MSRGDLITTGADKKKRKKKKKMTAEEEAESNREKAELELLMIPDNPQENGVDSPFLILILIFFE